MFLIKEIIENENAKSKFIVDWIWRIKNNEKVKIYQEASKVGVLYKKKLIQLKNFLHFQVILHEEIDCRMQNVFSFLCIFSAIVFF